MTPRDILVNPFSGWFDLERTLEPLSREDQDAVRDASAKRGIRNAEEGGEVSIPLHGIREPTFHHGSGGIRDHVLPGNKEYRAGDEIPRPPSGGGGGGLCSHCDGRGSSSCRVVLDVLGVVSFVATARNRFFTACITHESTA